MRTRTAGLGLVLILSACASDPAGPEARDKGWDFQGGRVMYTQIFFSDKAYPPEVRVYPQATPYRLPAWRG